jgi:hypothetical protein
MIKVKPGVTFACHPAGFRILEALKTVAIAAGCDLTITSGSDGVHSGPTDPHKSGQAYDIRTKDLTTEKKLLVLAGVQAELGPRFFAFLEAPNTANEHMHVQRTKGTVYTMTDYLAA